VRPPVYGRRKAAVDLDTTRWANGRHEFFVAAYSSEPGLPPVAMLRVPVTWTNRRTVREVRPRFRDLFLAPGETADLAPRLVYTDDTQQPLKDGVRFASDTPAVAAVDRTGLVKGIAPGVATVSLTAHGREATARVIVDKADGFPHFAR